jgi:hypothetical protein
MGSPWSFECRREELQLLQQQQQQLLHNHHFPIIVNDDTVAQTYIDLISPPNGLLFQYLKYGVMALCLEDTLYVHGGINPRAIGYVPPHANKTGTYLPTVSTWIEAINTFKQFEIEDYEQRIHEYLTSGCIQRVEDCWDMLGGYNHPQPGSRLIQSGMGSLPDNSMNPTVIYTSYMSKEGSPIPPDQRVVTWLQLASIHKLIVGHQPMGDAPIIMQHQQTYTSSDKSSSKEDSGIRSSIQSQNSECNSFSVISSDICYSKFVQYRITDLIKGLATAQMIPQSVAGSQDEEEWLTAENFLEENPKEEKDSFFNDKADTRGQIAVTDVCLEFVDPPRSRQFSSNFSTGSDTASRSVQIAKVDVKGILSQGTEYHFQLDPDDPIIGKEVSFLLYIFIILIRY